MARPSIESIDLEASLLRNVILVSSLALFFHNAGARAIPWSGAPHNAVDVVWLALMCGGAGVVEIGGVALTVDMYHRAVKAGHVPANETLVVLMWALGAATVAFFSLVYPLMFLVAPK